MWFGRRELQGNSGKRWDDAYELLVQFEINTPEARRLLRPYVAVWVEDKEGVPVRTLLLWYQLGRGVRWLNNLKRWVRGEKLRQLADGGDQTTNGAVTGATRQPGKYKVVWNGRDDQGKPVTQGTYTICVEAAREHGTYQLLRKEVTLTNKPLKADLGGNIEIKTASLEYRRK
ncbi:MAG: DUF2271 domain-containing protein [Armatimonas sp.]